MAALVFRTLTDNFLAGLFGPRTWPGWVRALAGKSGVYVIRRRFDKQVLYVGESHRGRLKKTLLRHFQAWSGKTAGPVFAADSVEVAVVVCAAAQAVKTQDRLIAELQPAKNTLSPAGPLEDDGDPF